MISETFSKNVTVSLEGGRRKKTNLIFGQLLRGHLSHLTETKCFTVGPPLVSWCNSY